MSKVFLSKKRKAFGLLEVLLSGVIIAVVTGVLVFAQRSALANSEYVKEKATALYLEQQAIEKVRQMRDSNWIDGVSTTQWRSFGYDGSQYGVDLNLSQVNKCRIVENSSTKRFYLSCLTTDNQETISVDGIDYRRQIIVAQANSQLLPGVNNADPAVNTSLSNALKITAEVTWTVGNKTFVALSPKNKTVTASEILTNWRPEF